MAKKAHTRTGPRAKAKADSEKAPKKAAKKAKTKAAKKAVKKAVKPASTPAARIIAFALSLDGASAIITLSSRKKIRLAAAAAQSLRVRPGAAWTDAMAARVARLELEQRTYARALEIVASHPRMTKAELLARLGDRSEARAAVKALASLGWM